MNDMRKLMEAINSINEGNEQAEFALNELRAAMNSWHEAISKFQSVYDPNSVGLEGWIEGDLDVMYDIESELDDPIDEANQGGKTEHSGAKKGKGAYYGRKKEAKRDSNKNRRKADKAAVNEEGQEHDEIFPITPITSPSGEYFTFNAVRYNIVPDDLIVKIWYGGTDVYEEAIEIEYAVLKRIVDGIERKM